MWRRISFILIAILLPAIGSLPGERGLASPQTDTREVPLWLPRGPRGGRALALELSPNFSGDGVAFSGEWLTSFQSTESGIGIVRSTDGGRTWSVSDAGTEDLFYASAVHDFAFSPNFRNDYTVFAATWGGLFESSDRGHTWSWLEGAYSGPPGAYTSIAVSPDFAQSELVLAGDWGGLLRSNDGGESWERFDEVGAAADIAFSPAYATEPIAFASDGATVHRSQDHAQNWTRVLTAPVTSLVVSPAFASDRTVFGSGGNFVYASDDAGTTWISRTVAAEVTGLSALAISPAYATDNTLFAGASNGLYWSRDGGATWEPITAYSGVPVRSLAISPQWPQHVALLVGTDHGVYRMLTTDPPNGIAKQATSGFVPLSASPLAWSADANLLLTAASSHGVYGSNDDGKSWRPMGLHASSSYYSFSDVVISPAYVRDQTLFVSWLSGTGIGAQVYRTQDAGQNWEGVYSTDYIGDLAISPAFDTDGTIFATSNEKRLVRSTNGGEDWEQVGNWSDTQPTGGVAQYIALPPGYPNDGTLFVGGSKGFWRLPEGASQWQPAASGLTSEYTVVSLAVSPDYSNDAMLLALAYTSDTSGQQFDVFRTEDGGVNWQKSSTGVAQASLFDVTFSPEFAQDQTVYLTMWDRRVYRSVNGGQSWILLGAAPGSPGFYDVIAREDGKVFVGSDKGVWEYTVATGVAYLPISLGPPIAQ